MISEKYLQYLNQQFPNQVSSYLSRKISQEYIIDDFSTGSEQNYQERLLEKQEIVSPFLEKYIQSITSKKDFPLFNKIEIETINRCNNSCEFCPVSAGNDIRSQCSMTKELFESLIDQLHSLQYKGAINLFSNNEPLLDKRIISFLQYARNELPNAYIFLYTNGLLLTESSIPELLEYTDFLHVNNYNDTKELLSSTETVLHYLKEHNISPQKVEIHLRNKKEILSSRGGDAPNRKDIEPISAPCILPFSQMVVRPDGKVSLCCNDAYGQYTLGDLTTEKIEEVWQGTEFCNLRAQMIQNRAQQYPACSKCDFIFMPLAFENEPI